MSRASSRTRRQRLATTTRPANRNPERLMTVLLAPVVSKRARSSPTSTTGRSSACCTNATKPEIKAAVELMFKVEVESVQIVNVKGKEKRFGRFMRPPRQLEEGVREPEAGPGNQLRGRRAVNHGTRQSQTDFARPPRARQGRHIRTCTRAGRSTRSLESAEARLGPQQQRPHHDAPQGRRPQAPLPHRRFQAQQGRHPGEGRAHRVRPEPQRAHRAAAATPTASAATSSRRAA